MVRIAIAIGGVAGAFGRHGAGILADAWSPSSLPWGTLVVNVAGSFVLGWLVHLLPATTLSPAVRAGLTVGFCGGFTTFSSFAHETVALARVGHVPLAAAYAAASLLLGPAALVAGLKVSAAFAGGRSRASSPARGVAPPPGEPDGAVPLDSPSAEV